MLTHGSLFAGVGGFDLGAEMAEIKTHWCVEIDNYNSKILKQNNPNATIYTDIREFFPTPTDYVSIISGGFPCQDISTAGKGKGITGERSGLWREMYRVIRDVRPEYAIIENSPALLYRGFETVLQDLSKIGYNAEWQVISNVAFGFPHRRARLYVIAYPSSFRQERFFCDNGRFDSIFTKLPPNAPCGYSEAQRIFQIPNSATIRRNDGIPNYTHRVKALGNAVNPFVAKYLFECIKQHKNRC